MRTTLNIDDTLLRDLRALAKEKGDPLKVVIDKALRAGLEGLRKSPKRKSFHARTFALGLPAGVNLDKARQIADDMEDGEIVRKMALRK